MSKELIYFVFLFWFFALIHFCFAKMGYGVNASHLIVRKFYIDKKKAKKDEVKFLFGISFMTFVIGLVFLIIAILNYYQSNYVVLPKSNVNLIQYDFGQLALQRQK